MHLTTYVELGHAVAAAEKKVLTFNDDSLCQMSLSYSALPVGRPYYSYSVGDFEVCCPAGKTRFTD